jgi:hypothetical protein
MDLWCTEICNPEKKRCIFEQAPGSAGTGGCQRKKNETEKSCGKGDRREKKHRGNAKKSSPPGEGKEQVFPPAAAGAAPSPGSTIHAPPGGDPVRDIHRGAERAEKTAEEPAQNGSQTQYDKPPDQRRNKCPCRGHSTEGYQGIKTEEKIDAHPAGQRVGCFP